MYRTIRSALRYWSVAAVVGGSLFLGANPAWAGAPAHAASDTEFAAGAPLTRSVPPTGLVMDAGGALVRAGGGLFRSQNGGTSWKALHIASSLHPEKLRWVATVTTAPSRLYAAGPGAGVIRSDDAGRSWRAISAGLPSKSIGAFAAHSYQSDTIYAWIDGKGVYKSQFGGTDWQKMDGGPGTSIRALAHSTLPGSMNTGWLYAAGSKGIYLSMDCF